MEDGEAEGGDDGGPGLALGAPDLGSRMLHSHWSRNVEVVLSLVESFLACASNLMP